MNMPGILGRHGVISLSAAARELGCTESALRTCRKATKKDPDPMPVLIHEKKIYAHIPTLIEWAETRPGNQLKRILAKYRAKKRR